VRQAFLGPAVHRRGKTWRRTLIHVPLGCDHMILGFFGENVVAGPVELRALSRRAAGLRLLLDGWRLLPRAMLGDPAGMAGRVRALLGQAPARAGEAPPYAAWIDLYDKPDAHERALLVAAVAAEPAPSLQIVLLDPRSDAPACAASVASLGRQWWPADAAALAEVAKMQAWPSLTADWIAIIEAGEIVTAHALAHVARAIQSLPDLAFICADTDLQGPAGSRCSPRFKPSPGPILLPSGQLTTGICVFRRNAVSWHGLPAGGDAARRALACSLSASGGAPRMLRLPRILTHLPSHATHSGQNPVERQQVLPRVSMIVPTAARSSHVVPCLRAIACGTDYPDFEILVTVSCIDPKDRRQARILRRLASLPRTRIVDAGLATFNYAEANNRAAALASGECLLLLNDDVAPIEPLWLRRMMALLRGRTAIVGARLLYGNLMVQHGGVIMGLAELCEHDGKFSDRADAWPGASNRDVSAVTGACMLVRAELYRALGGLDTAFAIALNDVDFCLRARKAGAGIGFCGQATLFHYESLSLGRHYEGERAGLEGVEVRLLRERWQAVIHSDPFYNPQASREPGREWQPAFPPAHCVG
jgi:GT2 family glycosyltransferase